jgi:hypothetical protein
MTVMAGTLARDAGAGVTKLALRPGRVVAIGSAQQRCGAPRLAIAPEIAD